MYVTHLDIVMFFVKQNESIDHLIGNGSVKKYIIIYYVPNLKTMLYILFHVVYM